MNEWVRRRLFACMHRLTIIDPLESWWRVTTLRLNGMKTRRLLDLLRLVNESFCFISLFIHLSSFLLLLLPVVFSILCFSMKKIQKAFRRPTTHTEKRERWRHAQTSLCTHVWRGISCGNEYLRIWMCLCVEVLYEFEVEEERQLIFW